MTIWPTHSGSSGNPTNNAVPPINDQYKNKVYLVGPFNYVTIFIWPLFEQLVG